MKKLKIFLVGGDNAGWALDTDGKLAIEALNQISDCIKIAPSISQANLLHSVCPEALIEDRKMYRYTQPVVAVFSNDPTAMFQRVPGLLENAKTWHCVAQTTDALNKLQAAGISDAFLVPYIADLKAYKPLDNQVEQKELRTKYGLPLNQYLIGSFQRDSNGADLNTFKEQKGADIFLEILKKLPSKNFHVVLAGPRRHWIRKQLKEAQIPFTFIGENIEKDDFPKNILRAETICELMQAIDLYAICSRWEGAPRAALEAAACKTPIISSAVGIASDLLNLACIYKNTDEAAGLIAQDLQNRFLKQHTEEHFQTVHKNHSVSAAAPLWKKFYSQLTQLKKPLARKTPLRLTRVLENVIQNLLK